MFSNLSGIISLTNNQNRSFSSKCIQVGLKYTVKAKYFEISLNYGTFFSCTFN